MLSTGIRHLHIEKEFEIISGTWGEYGYNFCRWSKGSVFHDWFYTLISVHPWMNTAVFFSTLSAEWLCSVISVCQSQPWYIYSGFSNCSKHCLYVSLCKEMSQVPWVAETSVLHLSTSNLDCHQLRLPSTWLQAHPELNCLINYILKLAKSKALVTTHSTITHNVTLMWVNCF